MVATIAAILVVALIAWIGATNSWVRARRQRVQRRKQRERREAHLEEACCPRERHAAISTLVDYLADVAPDEVKRLELDWLLDRHAALLLDRRRLADALAFRTREPREEAHATRKAVHEHELAWRASCAQSIFTIDDQLAAIEELVRLYCDHVTLPEVSHLVENEGLDRRIAIVDAEDGITPGVA